MVCRCFSDNPPLADERLFQSVTVWFRRLTGSGIQERPCPGGGRDSCRWVLISSGMEPFNSVTDCAFSTLIASTRVAHSTYFQIWLLICSHTRRAGFVRKLPPPLPSHTTGRTCLAKRGAGTTPAPLSSGRIELIIGESGDTKNTGAHSYSPVDLLSKSQSYGRPANLR